MELVTIGYNTPSTNGQQSAEGLVKRLFHSDLSLQAGAYQNATYVVGVAKGGIEDGHPLMGGSIIVDPNGFVLARAATEEDELILAPATLHGAPSARRRSSTLPGIVGLNITEQTGMRIEV